MRDLHYDGAFVRDFNEASKNWSWATWHQARATQQDTVAQRLLEEVFGPAAKDAPSAIENDDKSEE